MFSYNISKVADKEAFLKACADVETTMEAIKKEKLLVDVDGSMVQWYNTLKGKIAIFNDYEVDAVYVDSEVDISCIF